MVQVIFCYLYHCCFYRERIGKEIKNTENCGRVEMSAEIKIVPESNEEMEDTIELRKIINPAGTAQNINILGKFCGKRDVERLTSEQLQKKYGIAQADVMVLFGGSIHFSHSTVVKQRYKAAAENGSMFFCKKSKIVRIFNLKIKRITAYKMVDC